MKELVKTLDQAIGDLYLMKAPVSILEKYFDQEVMFNHDNKTYLWQGDFIIELSVVTIEQTYSFSCLQHQCEVILTDELQSVLEKEISNNY